MQDKNPDRLRADICNYLESNPNLMEDLSFNQIIGLEIGMEENSEITRRYISSMRDPSTWGGAIEIKAFCELYHANVEVIILADGKKVLFQPQKPSEILLRISWNGAHFEPVA